MLLRVTAETLYQNPHFTWRKAEVASQRCGTIGADLPGCLWQNLCLLGSLQDHLWRWYHTIWWLDSWHGSGIFFAYGDHHMYHHCSAFCPSRSWEVLKFFLMQAGNDAFAQVEDKIVRNYWGMENTFILSKLHKYHTKPKNITVKHNRQVHIFPWAPRTGAAV